MAELTIRFTWKVETPLHVGTGMSRAGYVDRVVRSHDGRPYLPGDAVKGAIRGSAERLYHWLVPTAKPEADDEKSSLPRNGVLCRIFAPEALKASTYAEPAASSAAYRFPPSLSLDPAKTDRSASTRIDSETGAAMGHTLRFIERWVRVETFPIAIEASGGDWAREPDFLDLQFLFMAVLCADAVGGKRGIGYGRVEIRGLPAILAGIDRATLAERATVEAVRSHLQRWEPDCKNDEL